MPTNYIKLLKVIFLLSIFILTCAKANTIDTSKSNKISILEKSNIYLDEKDLRLQEILKQNLFLAYKKPYINIGMHQQTVWVNFTIHNNSQDPMQKLLVLSSPMLEHISLYEKGSLDSPILSGRANNTKEHKTLFYYYNIKLEANTSQKYYLKVRSYYTPVDFALTLEDEPTYIREDISQQLVTVMLLGIIMALMLYSFLISFYTKDRSYFFYSIYLFTLIYQQISYLGLTQIYLPLSFNIFDMQIPNFKGSFVLITSALFAMHFLKTEKNPLLNKIYKFFILISIFEMIFFILFQVSSMYLLSITVLLYITFNLIAGIISYIKGEKQARLFIVGFGIIFISYMMIVTDAMGLTSIMQSFQNALIWGTALEALILSLAFADRYTILRYKKEKADQLILSEAKNREKIVQKEVRKKTSQLNDAVKTKEMLLYEMNHRVKNNLQIILSIIRLQNDEIKNVSVTEKLTNLENRVNAISKTYEMLLNTNNFEKINMKTYIESLLIDISKTCEDLENKINIRINIKATIPLKESTYVGLIINELVTNAYKHAFTNHKGIIKISLLQNKNHFTLTVEDNGKGYTLNNNNNTLGLKLMHTLIYNQLEGNMEQHTHGYTKYIIRFNI